MIDFEGMFSLFVTLFWLWMLLDAVFNMRPRTGNRAFWIIFIFFTYGLGAFVYFITERPNRNPVPLLNRLLEMFKNATGSPSQPYYQPPQSTPYYQPPAASPPSPTAPAYSDYTRGYQAQQATPDEVLQPEPGPQYEEPMISYPETPLQQQQQ